MLDGKLTEGVCCLAASETADDAFPADDKSQASMASNCVPHLLLPGLVAKETRRSIGTASTAAAGGCCPGQSFAATASRLWPQDSS